MKTITMSELRAEPGEVIRAVQRNGESFSVTKNGQPVARIIPIEDMNEGVSFWAQLSNLHKDASY